MKKTQDRILNLAEEGLAARCRIRLFEREGSQEADLQWVLLMSWELNQPGLPLDDWVGRITDEVLDTITPSCGTLLLVEHYPERRYLMGNLTMDFAEEIHQARLRPEPGGRFALLSFGAIERIGVEAIIGESLDTLIPEEATR